MEISFLSVEILSIILSYIIETDYDCYVIFKICKKWTFTLFFIFMNKPKFKNKLRNVFIHLCEQGNLNEIKCFQRHAMKIKTNIWNDATLFQVLETCCCGGQLKLVKWLHHTFDITNYCTKALMWSCEYGHLNFADWVFRTFKLKAEDARNDDNYALRWTCSNGHIKVAKWLQATFNLTIDDIRANENQSFKYSCLNNHTEVTKWIHDTFELTAEDARCNDNYALKICYEKGYLEVAQWLHRTFNLTAEDSRGINYYALHKSCRSVELAKWIDSILIKRIVE